MLVSVSVKLTVQCNLMTLHTQISRILSSFLAHLYMLFYLFRSVIRNQKLKV